MITASVNHTFNCDFDSLRVDTDAMTTFVSAKSYDDINANYSHLVSESEMHNYSCDE